MAVVVAVVVATWKNFNFVYILFLILILYSVGESANEKKTKRKLCVEENRGRGETCREKSFLLLLNNKKLNFSCRENDEMGFITRLGS
jgi:hypothetical protein